MLLGEGATMWKRMKISLITSTQSAIKYLQCTPNFADKNCAIIPWVSRANRRQPTVNHRKRRFFRAFEHVTRGLAVARIADRTGCHRPSRSSNSYNFHFIWKGVCHFLLVINTNLGRISHRFRNMVSSPLRNTFSLPPLHSTQKWKTFPSNKIAESLHT